MYQEIIRLDLLERPALGVFSPSRDTLRAALSCLHDYWKTPEAGSSWDLQQPLLLATIGRIAAGLKDLKSFAPTTEINEKDRHPQELQAAAISYLLEHKHFEILAEVLDTWEANPNNHKVSEALRYRCGLEGCYLLGPSNSLNPSESTQLVRFIKYMFLGPPEESNSKNSDVIESYEFLIYSMYQLPSQLALDISLDVLQKINESHICHRLISKEVGKALIAALSDEVSRDSAMVEGVLEAFSRIMPRVPFQWQDHYDDYEQKEVFVFEGSTFSELVSCFLVDSRYSAQERIKKFQNLTGERRPWEQKILNFHLEVYPDCLPVAYEALKPNTDNADGLSLTSLNDRDFFSSDSYRYTISYSTCLLLDHLQSKESLDQHDLNVCASALEFALGLAERESFVNQISKKALTIYLNKNSAWLTEQLNSKSERYVHLLALMAADDPNLSTQLFELQGLDSKLKTCLAWGVKEQSLKFPEAEALREIFCGGAANYQALNEQLPAELKAIVPRLIKQGIPTLGSLSIGAFECPTFRLFLSHSLERKELRLSNIIDLLTKATEQSDNQGILEYIKNLEKINREEVRYLLPFRLGPDGLKKVIEDRSLLERETNLIGDKVKALVIQAPSDHNGALPRLEAQFSQLFSEDAETLFFIPQDLRSIKEVIDFVNRCNPDGFDIILVNHHGERSNATWNVKGEITKDFANYLGSKLKGEHLIISSCSAFQGGIYEPNLANSYARGAALPGKHLDGDQRFIYAPTEPASPKISFEGETGELEINTGEPYVRREISPLSCLSIEFFSAKLSWFLGYLRATIR